MKKPQSTISTPQSAHGGVFTLGNFDGMHRGHKKLIDYLKRRATATGVLPTVMTFWPHPKQFFHPDQPFDGLYDVQDRQSILQSWGIEQICVVPFTKKIASLSAEEFVRHHIVPQFAPSCFVIGYDLGFGAGRQDAKEVLEALGPQLGFEVHRVEPFCLNNKVVSSTHIRHFLRCGDVKTAWLWLGRPYFIRGKVVKGVGRGRSIGIPTANLETFTRCLTPPKGVYQTFVRWNNQNYLAVTNIGTRPTFNADNKTHFVETHLLATQNQLNKVNLPPSVGEGLSASNTLNMYGASIQLHFLERIRDEQRFSSVEELVAQIKKDIQKAYQLKVHFEMALAESLTSKKK